jgi:hypothetical protein
VKKAFKRRLWTDVQISGVAWDNKGDRDLLSDERVKVYYRFE